MIHSVTVSPIEVSVGSARGERKKEKGKEGEGKLHPLVLLYLRAFLVKNLKGTLIILRSSAWKNK
jgi:hypothetical protein